MRGEGPLIESADWPAARWIWGGWGEEGWLGEGEGAGEAAEEEEAAAGEASWFSWMPSIWGRPASFLLSSTPLWRRTKRC